MSAETPKKSGLLKIVAIVVGVLLVALIALPFLIDVNQFRPRIQSTLSEALGRDVTLGNIKLSIFSGSLRVDDIAIADHPDFGREPFVKAKSLKVGIEMRPLIFSKEVRITGISLDRPEIRLIRSASGKWNFADLGGKEGAGKEGGGSSDASQTGVLVRKLEITDGTVTRIEGQRKPVVYDHVRLTASNLSFTTSFPFALSASLPGGGDFRLEGKAGPLGRTDLLTTPLEASIDVKRFDLVASGFADPGSGMSGLVDFSGNAVSDGRQAASSGKANVEKLQAAKGGSPAAQPVSLEYALNYDLGSRKGNLTEAAVRIGKAVARLEGTFAQQAEASLLKMRLRGTDMPVEDLAGMLPAFGVTLPKGASLQGGAMNVDLTAEGPADRLVTSGTVNVAKTRLTGFDLAGKMAALSQLAGLKSSQQTEIEKFATGIRMGPEGVDVSAMQMILPALGELSGRGKIAADQTLDFTMRALLKPSGGVAGGLSRLTGGNGLDLPFFIRGTASDPKFVPDAGKAAGSILGSVLKGKGEKDAKSGTGSGVEDTLRGLFKKK